MLICNVRLLTARELKSVLAALKQKIKKINSLFITSPTGFNLVGFFDYLKNSLKKYRL